MGGIVFHSFKPTIGFQRLASRHESGDTLCSLLIYLQFSVIKWAKAPGPEDPIDIKSDEAIQM